MKQRFAAGLKPMESLMLKARFTEGKDTEWMWLDVVRWENGKVEGLLRNDPEVLTHLKFGSRIQVPESEVCTYQLQNQDGGVEGFGPR